MSITDLWVCWSIKCSDVSSGCVNVKLRQHFIVSCRSNALMIYECRTEKLFKSKNWVSKSTLENKKFNDLSNRVKLRVLNLEYLNKDFGILSPTHILKVHKDLKEMMMMIIDWKIWLRGTDQLNEFHKKRLKF